MEHRSVYYAELVLFDCFAARFLDTLDRAINNAISNGRRQDWLLCRVHEAGDLLHNLWEVRKAQMHGLV